MKKSLSQIKKQALDFEQTNYQYLQFVDSTKNFKQLFDNSALIFKSNIAQKIGYKTINFRPDTSASSPKAKYGVISFKNFNNLKTKLEDLGISEEKSLNSPSLTYFKLKKIYKKSEIDSIVKSLDNEKQKFQKIITPKNPHPVLFVRLENLEKMQYDFQILRFCLKTVENLNLIHAKNFERILTELVIIERIIKKELNAN